MNGHRALILGESASGKTHLAAQMLGRLRNPNGKLRFRKQPAQYRMLEGVLDDLAEGRSARHTPADFYDEIIFNLTDSNGTELDLVWPDYAGEQVSEIVMKRALRPEWSERIEKADSFILLVRLSGVVDRKSALFAKRSTSSRNVDPNSDKSGTDVGKLPEQLRLIELLQILKHKMGGAASGSKSLIVLLSCADELGDMKIPRDVLEAHMPMLSSFLSANWDEGSWNCWGVSALGRPLKNDVRDEEFENEGPHKQGWVVAPSGCCDPDLTLPFASILETE